MRSSALDNLAQDYIRLARAKGLSERRCCTRHLLRNACLPMITLVGLSIPTLLAGNLLIEVLFNYPGLGLLFYNALGNEDYRSCSPTRSSAAILTVLGNLVADIAVTVADPRVRLELSQRRRAAASRPTARARLSPTSLSTMPEGGEVAGHRQRLAAGAARVPRQPARGRRRSCVIVFFVLFCFLGPLFYHTNQTLTNPLIDRPAARAAAHPLGTDEHGFDELGRIMVGGQTALEIGFFAAFIATVIGTLYGADLRARRRPRRRRS